MKTITITAWRRPEYLRRSLESLRLNRPGGFDWILNCALEPGCPETVNVCSTFDWPSVVIEVNRTRLGVRRNPYEALRRAFGRGSDMNLYLEEDVILSPDVIRMAEWFWQQTRPVPDRWLSLNLLRYDSDPSDPTGLTESKAFNALGFVLTRESWERWFEPAWNDDDLAREVHGPQVSGWDWAVTALLAKHPGLGTLTPALSRSNHIGREGGIHASPEFHDKAFGNLVLNADPDPGEYVIRGSDLSGRPRPNQSPGR